MNPNKNTVPRTIAVLHISVVSNKTKNISRTNILFYMIDPVLPLQLAIIHLERK